MWPDTRPYGERFSHWYRGLTNDEMDRFWREKPKEASAFVLRMIVRDRLLADKLCKRVPKHRFRKDPTEP